MGNCLRHESSMQWGGDDWGSPVPDRFFTRNYRQYGKKDEDMMLNMEEEVLLGDNKGMSSSTSTNISATSSTEVKIKITKKQLEELLGRVDMKQISVEQVLAQLIKVGGDGFESHHRSWRPNLQSIPE